MFKKLNRIDKNSETKHRIVKAHFSNVEATIIQEMFKVQYTIFQAMFKICFWNANGFCQYENELEYFLRAKQID